MIYPSIDEITKNQYNRYTLCIAVAKCARIITDEYVRQRENAERMLANKETDKTLASLIKREYRDEKAVKMPFRCCIQVNTVLFRRKRRSMKAVYMQPKMIPM